MVLTALLKISSEDEPRQPETRYKKADSLHFSALQGNNVKTTPDSINSPAEPRAPLPFH
jgi:hypothetical protein